MSVSKQSPSAGSQVIQGEKVLLLTDGDLTVPNFSGWSIRDVMKAASLMEVELNTSGSGYAITQKPKAGTKLKDDIFLVVQFENPKTIYEKSKENSSKTKEEDVESD